MGYFLGIDGGQSHTTALVADARGHILGVGHAGESNHTRAPGGQARLINAINQSVSQAWQQAGLRTNKIHFASAYLSMTGEPADKREIVNELLSADVLMVEHDTHGALAGAFAGGAGIIVLAGTGSVACGECVDEQGERRFVRVGGRGYLFADEGSAFAIARQAVSLALRRADRVDGFNRLQRTLLKHFKRRQLHEISEDVYAGVISREQLAGFTAQVDALTERGDWIAQAILENAAADLAELAEATQRRLNAKTPLDIAYGGGVFQSRHLLATFIIEVYKRLPQARVVVPRCAPEAGALLLAFRQAGKPLTPRLLAHVTRQGGSL
jgi:N-acetylglucosamine kinase-like BadF-type ATPase